MNLLVEGKLLKNPNAQLSESNLTSHSMVTCEYNPALHGGMQNSSPKVQPLQPAKESSRHKPSTQNEDEETPDEDVRSKVQSAAKSEESKSLNMEEFDALNENIVTAKASDAEVRRFEDLAQLYAQKEVEDYQFSEEEQKERIDKNQCGEQYKEKINFA